MSLPPGHPPFTGGRHTIRYFLKAPEYGRSHREVDVHATAGEIAYFATNGFLVRERLFTAEHTATLKAALDEVIEREGREKQMNRSRNYGGVFLRHLMDKHPAFLDLIRFEPVLSIVRAILGPLVSIRGFSARVSYPDQKLQETEWHYHQRVYSDPVPPWFMAPQLVDVLMYLDDANAANGQLCVVPGSHTWYDRDLPPESYDDRPDQVALDVPAGSVVFTHGNIWHRATPTTPAGQVRRLLIWGFGPTWMRPSGYGVQPADGLTKKLLAESDDPVIRELLGVGIPF